MARACAERSAVSKLVSVRPRLITSGGNGQQAGALAIFSGVAIDLLSDGVMIGTGTVLKPALALLLAPGPSPRRRHGRLAAVATLRRAGIGHRNHLLLSAAFVVPILLGATVGFFALRDAPELITVSVLALTGGALTAVVTEEMVSEAHEGETSKLGPLALTDGFALFGAISVYLGS